MTTQFEFPQLPPLLSDDSTYLKVFICHATESKAEAEHYDHLLGKHFTVWYYERDKLPGDAANDRVRKEIKKAIERCDYFLLLVSDDAISLSDNKKWCACELGLALRLQKERQDKGGMGAKSQRPVVVPIYCKAMSSREKGKRPRQFPVRDFDTGELHEPYSFDGLDPHRQNARLKDDQLLELMKPRVLRVRRDINDPLLLKESGVFDLYESLFPESERDDIDATVRWAIKEATGQRRSVTLPKRRSLTSWSRKTAFHYQLDTLFYYVTLYKTPIALCTVDIDAGSGLIAGNYIATGSGWRAHGVTDKFWNYMERDAIRYCKEKGYPDPRGVLFEVEHVDLNTIDRFLLENAQAEVTVDETHPVYTQVRRLRRVNLYQEWMSADVYVDAKTKVPLAYTAPCLNIELPREQWKQAEEEYWLMWYCRTVDTGRNPSWEEAVKFYCIEVQAKSVALMYRNAAGAEYLEYAEEVAKRNVRRAPGRGDATLDRISVGNRLSRLEKIIVNYDEIAL